MEKILDILSHAPTVPGRLQPVPNPRGLKIYIDFAHSDDALLNVLDCLQELKKEPFDHRLWLRGRSRPSSNVPKWHRSPKKTPISRIVTSDNPRSEDPHEIARQVV